MQQLYVSSVCVRCSSYVWLVDWPNPGPCIPNISIFRVFRIVFRKCATFNLTSEFQNICHDWADIHSILKQVLYHRPLSLPDIIIYSVAYFVHLRCFIVSLTFQMVYLHLVSTYFLLQRRLRSAAQRRFARWKSCRCLGNCVLPSRQMSWLSMYVSCVCFTVYTGAVFNNVIFLGEWPHWGLCKCTAV